MSDFTIDDDLILDYLAESQEHLATIETDLLLIERAGAAIDEDLVNRVFRAAHSIKGGAGFFDLLQIKELAHRTESVLDLIRSGQMAPNSEIVSILLMAFDQLRSLILDYRESNNADISEFTAALTRLAEEHLSPDKRSSTGQIVTIPVPHSERQLTSSVFDMDQARRSGKSIYVIQYDLIHDLRRFGGTSRDIFHHLIEFGDVLTTGFDLSSAGTLDDEPSNELIVDVLFATALDARSVTQILDVVPDRVHEIEHNSAALLKPTPDPDAAAVPGGQIQGNITPAQTTQMEATVRLNVALLDSLMTLAGELVLGRNQLNEAVRDDDKQGISAGAHRVSLVTSELQEAVSLTRMQPVSSLFSKFPRLVRDLASELGKEVQLKLEGGDVELDKTIIEGLSDPLTHMVRNSVDHGIEPPAVRIAASKPALGTITLGARHQAGQVMIEISDDGKGLAVEKIISSALSKGVVTADQLQTMSDYDKKALIFMAGVSTAEKLSNVSGRGVGMDVVKTNLDKLGGKVEIDSAPGKGSSFRIKLPLTLAIIPSLLVSDSGQRFAIPQVSVGELIRIPADQITGNRTTLNNEYQGLLSEINRQASNVNLNTGGANNSNLVTYIGGGSTAANAQVSVDLSGATNAVDTTGLGIASTGIQGGGSELNSAAGPTNTVRLDNTATSFLVSNTQNFSFHIATSTGDLDKTIAVTGGASGLTGTGVISSLNTSLNQYGINASIGTDGTLEFGGNTAFSVQAQAAGGGNAVATTNSATINTANYNVSSAAGVTGGGGAVFTNFDATHKETLVFQNATAGTTVVLDGSVAGSAGTIGHALATLNTQLAGTGISAVADALDTSISFQSQNQFSVNETAVTAGVTGNLFGNTLGGAVVTGAVAGASDTGSAIAALAQLTAAGTALGLTQGTVGAGINKLNYAVNLAQSQITNFSAAESGIRDANIAAEAANLTKAQVLQQASLAQANASPQALLALLKG